MGHSVQAPTETNVRGRGRACGAEGEKRGTREDAAKLQPILEETCRSSWALTLRRRVMHGTPSRLLDVHGCDNTCHCVAPPADAS